MKISDMGGPMKERVILDPGEYKLRCNEVEVKPASTGNLQIKWTVVEVDSGVELTFYSSLHKNAFGITKNWLLAFGCKGEDDMPETEINWNQYLRRICRGKVAIAQIEIEEKKSTRQGAKPGEMFKVNIVSPPWEIYPVSDFKDETDVPDFLK